ncbi:hypothetical protein JZ751_025629 [Albula glossodonta]|uniref:Uncharacterized protein n=1 Tax=Albula glossodonta TaxID=121402 RepID=A0A8T2NHZ5_9TELE|nr:hypothetical protein JZ751_025629 [Albula glossodonta]
MSIPPLLHFATGARSPEPNTRPSLQDPSVTGNTECRTPLWYSPQDTTPAAQPGTTANQKSDLL